jgi:hypothetical protein
MNILDAIDSRIYALGLQEGIVTTKQVSESISTLGQSTAGARLKRLCSKGFFLLTPHEGADTRSGRKHPRKYRVVTPSVALKSIFESHKALQAATDQADQWVEIKAEEKSEEEDMWVAKPMKLAINHGISMIKGAKASIEIFGRDCTWLTDDGVTDAIQQAHGGGAKVSILATHPPHKSPIPGIGVELVNSISTLPFCIIDGSVLLIPFKSGRLQAQYSLLVVPNKYVVEGFSDLFRGLSQRDHHGEKQ